MIDPAESAEIKELKEVKQSEEETVEAKKDNRNSTRHFLRSREKVIVPVGRPYNVGKNKAKREKRAISGVRK